MIQLRSSLSSKKITNSLLVAPVFLAVSVWSGGQASADVETVSLEQSITSDPVTLYQHCSYGGYGVGLETGSYTMPDLQALGMTNNDLSSLTIEEGYEVTLYQDDEFLGDELFKTGDTSCLIEDKFNDLITSVVVSKTQSEITDVPSNLPDSRDDVDDLYDPVKYLYVSEFDVHIFATDGVKDETILGAQEMVINIIGNISSQDDRDAFKNYHVFVITEEDPDVPGGRTGNKNTGNSAYTIFTQDNICSVHAGSLYPDQEPKWRAWETPIHEFGHGIELVLDQRAIAVATYVANGRDIEASYELFAWGIQRWFDSTATAEDLNFRDNMPEYEHDYYSSIFDAGDVWQPSCDGF